MSCNPENIMDPVIYNNEDNECKITIINNDCLAHIFSFLPQSELIKIERVCKWWQCVSLKSWSTIKKVDAEKMLRWHPVRSDKPLKCILKRCGDYVKYLTVDLYHSDLKVVSKYCTDLQSLEITNFRLQNKIHDSSAFRHLEELKIFGGLVTDKRVEHLFELCPNIQSITFSKIWSSFGQFVVPRFQYLEKLEITHCERFYLGNVMANIRSMNNLKYLSIAASKDQVIRTQFIRTIESLPNLEHLRFSDCRGKSFLSTRLPTEISKHLISLNFKNNSFITDDLLKKVSLECVSLQSLNISGCNKVTVVGVRALAKLPDLKYLTLRFKKWFTDKDNVTDYELEQFALRGKLEKLKIRQNNKITNKGCSKILSLCDELEHFDISGCSLITDATMVAAETAIKYRTNNRKLKLLVGGTKVSNIEKWKNVNPLLVVHYEYFESFKTDPDLMTLDERPFFSDRWGDKRCYKIPPDILEYDSDESTNSDSNKSGCDSAMFRISRPSYSDDSD